MPKEGMLDRAADTSKLQLQEGASELLRVFRGHWSIVSVGWSGLFIRKALESRGVDLERTRKDVEIRANEVEFDEQGLGTGRLSKHKGNQTGIRIARDKQREMLAMVEEWRSSEEANEDDFVVVSEARRMPWHFNGLSWGTLLTLAFPPQYVGDSETDLLCMLEADLGIIMNSEGMVAKCEKLGLQVKHGLDNIIKRETQQDGARVLRSVDDFGALMVS